MTIVLQLEGTFIVLVHNIICNAIPLCFQEVASPQDLGISEYGIDECNHRRYDVALHMRDFQIVNMPKSI